MPLPTVALTLTALLLLAGPGSAQELAGRPIVEVELLGLVSLDLDEAVGALGIETGKPYDPGLLNRRLKELWDRGWLDNVAVEAEGIEAGVRLTVSFVERPRLAAVEYRGFTRIKPSVIATALEEEGIVPAAGEPIDLGELHRLERLLESLYRERGHVHVEIESRLETTAPGERRLIVEVDEARPVTIARVKLRGNRTFSDARLRSHLQESRASGPISRLRRSDRYRPASLGRDLERLSAFYRNHGFKDVVIGEPEVTFIDRDRVEIVIPVEEGERWRLGEVTIAGSSVFDASDLVALVPLSTGDWLHDDLVETGVGRIVQRYSAIGYAMGRVTPTIEERPAGVADLLITIDEGEQFRVGRIEFLGNTATQDRFLRRELALQEGMVFDVESLRRSLLKLDQLELFDLDPDEPIEIDYDTDEHKVDLLIKGEEEDRIDVDFGGGLNDLDGLHGRASLRLHNPFASGGTLGLELQSGQNGERYELSYRLPWLFDRPQQVAAQLFSRELELDRSGDERFIRRERGAGLSWGRSLGNLSRLSLGYAMRELEDTRSRTADGAASGATAERLDLSRSTLSLGLTRDSHASRDQPTHGLRLRAGLEYGGGPLGGDSSFLRSTAGVTVTGPLSRRPPRLTRLSPGEPFAVGRINLEAGHIEPIGSEPALSFNDRFFLGGQQSLRGFDAQSIWVRDPQTGAAVRDEGGYVRGGESFFQLNLEHHLALAPPLRLVLFADLGNVYGAGQSLDLSRLRSSAGVELQVSLPGIGAPLRLIWARNLDPFDDLDPADRERFNELSFAFGLDF